MVELSDIEDIAYDLLCIGNDGEEGRYIIKRIDNKDIHLSSLGIFDRRACQEPYKTKHIGLALVDQNKQLILQIKHGKSYNT